MLRPMANEPMEQLSVGIQRVARDLRLLEQQLLLDCNAPTAVAANHNEPSLREAVRGFMHTLRRAGSLFGSRPGDRMPQQAPRPD
jgi:hypothetical protein